MNYRILSSVMIFTIAGIAFSCKEKEGIDEKGKSILNFKIESISYSPNVNQVERIIDFKVAARVNLADITPQIMISPGASISPPSGQAIDLTVPVIYTVTAGDGTSQSYTVTAEKVTDTAFVVIDMQNGAFTMPDHPIYNAAEITNVIKLMVEKTRTAGKKVVYSMNTTPTVTEGSYEWSLVPGLSFQGNDLVVLKTASDAFEASELYEEIVGIGAGTIIMCGVATNACINNSFNGASTHGFRIIMLADGHSTFGDDAAEIIASFNTNWANKGAAVLNGGEINF